MKEYTYNYYHANSIPTNHWWFRARNIIIAKLLNTFLINKKSINILDIGSGLGQLFPIWQKFGKVYGVEKNEFFVSELRKTYPDSIIWNSNFPDNKSKKFKYSLICMCDFLEHVQKPELVLKEIDERLENDGLLLVTVPAYSWLWSKKDNDLRHFRRYSKKQLINEVQNFNLEVLFSSYFMFLLFPFAIVIRKLINPLIKNKESEKLDLEYGGMGLTNNILYHIFKLEALLLKNKISLPYGLSVLGIFKKSK